MNKIWVLTTAYNMYDQQGDYFVAAWLSKPTESDIALAANVGRVEAEHIFNGGGRRKVEDQWFNLFEVSEGESCH